MLGQRKRGARSTRAVAKRVPRVDQLDQPGAIDMGVNLGGRDVRVTEQRLKHTQVRAAATNGSQKRDEAHAG